MEPFECSGVWWFPEDPSARVGGTLRFSSQGGLVLHLLGVLGKEGGPIGEKSRAVILGSAYDSPLGRHVTLTGCWRSAYTMRSSGLSNEEYHSDRAYFGQHLTTPEDFRFTTCSLRTNGLSSWAMYRTGLRFEYNVKGGEGGWEMQLRYTPPPILKAEIPGGTLELSINAGASASLREVALKEEVRFRLMASEPLTGDDWNGRFVYPLLNFLSLATDVPNALTKWTLADRERPSRSVNVILPRTLQGPAEERSVMPHQMLFPLEGLEDRFPALITRWLEVAEAHRDACNIFFGLWYAPGAYLDMRLLGICQSLHLYQTKRPNARPLPAASPPPSVLALLPEEAREELRRWVRERTIDTFRETLEQLAGEHEPVLSLLSPGGGGALIEQLMAFRNHALYRTPFPAPLEAYSHGLYLATETLAYLMKACFLSELGFSPDERLSFFERNAMYGFLRQEWARRWRLLATAGGRQGV